jgi:hypothetical protein
MKADDRSTAPETANEDRILVYGLSDEGRTAHVLRRRGGELEAGRLRPVESGKPLTGELVQLAPRPELPLLFDVEVKVPSPLEPRRHLDRSGPARVPNDAYRRGWDAVWGRDAGPEPPDPEDGDPMLQ